MTDRPIPFSPPMVRAILSEIEQPGAGKTQTRRILKPQPFSDGYFDGEVDCTFVPAPASNLSAYARFFASAVGGGAVRTETLTPPYAPGDRLWVKEAWRVWAGVDNLPPRDLRTDAIVIYEAGGSSEASEGYRRTSEWPASENSRPKNLGRYRHARFMPRWASRLTLIVTDVRVERLGDISEEDAIAEGVVDMGRRDGAPYSHCIIPGMPEITMEHEPSTVFAHLWEHINGPGSWEANPWVAVYGFRPVLANIDQMEPAHD